MIGCEMILFSIEETIWTGKLTILQNKWPLLSPKKRLLPYCLT